MDTITIALADVSKTANYIRTQNQQLFAYLQEINTAMNQLSTTWQSPASETIRARFHAMLPVFDNYKTIIDTYAKFLDQTVTSYQTLEAQLNSNAETFK